MSSTAISFGCTSVGDGGTPMAGCGVGCGTGVGYRVTGSPVNWIEEEESETLNRVEQLV